MDRLLHGRSRPKVMEAGPEAPSASSSPTGASTERRVPPAPTDRPGSREEELRLLSEEIRATALKLTALTPASPPPAPPGSPPERSRASVDPISSPRALPPRPAPASVASSGTPWRRPGETVRVGDVEIDGGWIYVGERLLEDATNAWTSQRNVPCLINPKLKVAAPEAAAADLSGYPNYADLTPAQRGRYMRWLAGDRSDPTTPQGYVRLYFFGLEHRLVADGPPPHEIVELAAEVARLGGVYGGKGAFRYHCERLVQALELKLLIDSQKIAGWRPPADAPTRQGLSAPLKVVIARKVVAGEPLDFELAMAGFLSLSLENNDDLNWIAYRAPRPLAALAAPAFAKKYPDGFLLRDRQSSELSSTYHSHHYNLRNPDWVKEAFGRLPDPQTLNWRGMAKLCTPLARRLAPYAHYLGKTRHPNSLEGLLLLPSESLTPEQSRRLQSVADTLAALAQPVGVIDMLEFATACIGSTEGWNLLKLRQVNTVLQGLGYGMEPDPDLSKVDVKSEPLAWVFRAPPDPAPPDVGLELATLLLSAVAWARSDDPVDAQGLSLWTTAAAAAFGVAAAHLPRLEARLRRLPRHAPHGRRLARAVEGVAAEDRARLAAAAGALATRAGDDSPLMMSALERFYELLGLDRRGLYADLHRRAADDLSVVEGAAPTTGYRIPSAPSSPNLDAGPVDMARVERISRETRIVSATLAAIYEDEEAAAQEAVIAPARGGDGLDGPHDRLLTELSGRELWSRDAFETLCRAQGLMAAAAVETLNDWAYERCDEPVLEEDQDWRVNQDIVEQARSAAA